MIFESFPVLITFFWIRSTDETFYWYLKLLQFSELSTLSKLFSLLVNVIDPNKNVYLPNIDVSDKVACDSGSLNYFRTKYL